MNYQHAFHAGNFADVHKHVVLTLILERLREKPAGFRVIDTHAGAGRYDLFGPEAVRSGEWHDGIERVFSAPEIASQALLAPYLAIIAALNAGGQLGIYPGSPLVAEAMLRRQDRLIACELDPRAATALKGALRGDARAKVLVLDGWMALKANVPPKERRGLVFVDPPYEDPTDFMRLSTVLAEAWRKWPIGIYVLWYPIKDRAAPDVLARRLKKLAIPKVLRCEITLGPPRSDAGLVGSGLIIVNPPYGLDEALRVLLPLLAALFSLSATSRVGWLAKEH